MTEMFVAGEWIAAGSGETFTAESPMTGQAIGEAIDSLEQAIELTNASPYGLLAAAPMEAFTELQRVVLS